MYDYKTKSHCHVGPKHVMKIGNVDIYAGGFYEVHNDLEWELRIRISDDTMPRDDTQIKARWGANKILPRSVTQIKLPPTLDIEWNDLSVPDLSPKWWADLAKALGEMKSGNVVIFCYGGHGRTGTALSILAALSGNSPPSGPGSDPVAWVRKNYCHNAVETNAQITYVERITGRKVHTKIPVNSSYGPYYNNYGVTKDSSVMGEKWEDDITQEDIEDDSDLEYEIIPFEDKEPELGT